MDSFRIRGGARLKGRVEISGSKNSALPIVAACLMAEGNTTLHGVPRLSDITSMTKLVAELGCSIRRRDPLTKTVGDGPDLNGPLDLEVQDETQCEARYDIVKTMRASICVLGPLLAKRGKAIVSIPGGCAIGDRPVDLHVRGLQKLGAEFTTEGGNIVGTVRGRLKGCRMYLGGAQGPTVLGTINVMCAAALAEGETVLVGAACEPEVADCADLLNKMGAKIRGHGTPEIRIEGVDKLVGVGHRIIPDRIECGTFIMAAAITNGELELHHCNLDHLIAVVDRLDEVRRALRAVRRRRARQLVPAAEPDRDGHPAVPRFPDRPAGPADGAAVPGRRHERGHRADLPRPVPARGRAEPHGCPHPQGRPDRHHPGREGTAGRQRDGQRPAGVGRAGHGRVGRQGDDPKIDRVYHIDRGYEKIEQKLAAVGADIERVSDSRVVAA